MIIYIILRILLIICLLIFSTATCNLWVGNGESTFDVLAYGAKGDDYSDDTQAFVKAWKALCGATQKDTIPKLVVPAGYTFFVRQIRFKGPCQSNQVHIQILGNLHAPQRNEWRVCSRRWLHFLGIGGMTIDGSGVINGQGQAWWENITQGCTGIPTGGKGHVRAITFDNIKVNQTNYSLYIDQHYMLTPEKPDALRVSNVTFSDIRGTCTNENAIVLDCAKIGCDNITLSEINITSIDPTKPASSLCNNVLGRAINVSPYVPCLH
ncbi:unnamed protein product [Lupinus luteus]|uniref:Polygalacturonase n=1 Tax=Lupinus luteus TaxID=3873 RepID=A0AAV1XNK0_LUPLU